MSVRLRFKMYGDLSRLLSLGWRGFLPGTVVFVLLLTGCQKAPTAPSYPVLGVDPLVDVLEFENGIQVFRAWIERGLKSATLVRAAAWGGLESIPPDSMNALKEIVSRRDLQALDSLAGPSGKPVVDDTNYIFAARELGVIGKVYWIMPSDIFGRAGSGVLLRQFVKTRIPYVNDAVLDAMSMRFGCLTGTIRELPLSLCGPEAIPFLKEPVLMDLSVDFVPRYAADVGVSPLRALKRIFDELNERAYPVMLATVTASTENGHLNPTQRYLGTEIVETLHDPALMKQESPPELWSARDTVDNMLEGGADPETVRDALDQGMEKFPEDPALKGLALAARFRAGRYEEIHDETQKLCADDKRDCAWLVYFGGIHPPTRTPSWGDRFFKTALSLRPDWKYALERYGDWLREAGRFADAIVQYERAVALENDYSLQLRMADAAVSLGQDQRARSFFEAALSLIAPDTELEMGGPGAEEMLKRFRKLYENSGREDVSRALDRLQMVVDSSPYSEANAASEGGP